MTKRKTLTKKIRFEIFKRDSFTCQYCGKKAPEVILHIDHIIPIAKGGTNDISNLITSCFECNSGKSDRELDDNSVMMKQRHQNELLQEKRSQLEMMFEWKKGLEKIEEDTLRNLIQHIENKFLKKYTINETGKNSLRKLLKKFPYETILESIDIASTSYIKYENNLPTKESVEHFLQKLSGVVAVKSMPPINQEIVKIKAIARKKFTYWNEAEASNILKSYTEALRSKNWTVEQILNELKQDVLNTVNESNNYRNWTDTIYGWIEDIKKFETNKKLEVEYIDLSKEKRFEIWEQVIHFNDMRIESLKKVSTLFPDFRIKPFLEELHLTITSFLYETSELYKSTNNNESIHCDYGFLDNFLESYEICSYFQTENLPYELISIAEKSGEIIKEILQEVYIPRFIKISKSQQFEGVSYLQNYYKNEVSKLMPDYYQ